MSDIFKNIGKKFIGIIKKIFSRKWVRVLAIILTVIIGGITILSNIAKSKFEQMQKDAIVTEVSEKRDIEKVLSSSGTIEPLNTYEVTTLVDGEVIAADFEEGEQIKEGDILYKITTEDLDTKIESAKTNVERAKRNYEKALEEKGKADEDYQDALDDLGDYAVKSDKDGIITELLIEEGSKIQAGTQIAKIYDNSYMLLTVPFSSADVKKSWVNKSAVVEIDGSSETLKGTITKVSSLEKVLTGNRVVKDVTIKVKNPGGITLETNASALVGNISSSGVGTFKAIEDSVIVADNSGEISKLSVDEGDRVKKGSVIASLDNDSIDDQLETYQKTVDNAKDGVDNARDNVEDAEKSLEEQIDALADYNVTAPISGQIITKNALVGDKIRAANMTNSLCTIYDLSALVFKMSIDELDIMSVKVGQEVKITADALPDAKITGFITNISLQSTTNGGVTQYPVTVEIKEPGNLLPGMNVTGEIVTERVSDVVSVPVDALMRGDIVYVKDESVKEAVGDIPAGFREVKVETGLSNDDYIEIKSGLEEGQEVYVVRQGGTTVMMMPGGAMVAPAEGGPGQGDGSQRGQRVDGASAAPAR